MTQILKAVFDTQVFLRSVIQPRSISAAISPEKWRGRYKLYISDETEAELVQVLKHPSIRAKFPQITSKVVERLINLLHEEAHRVQLEKPIPSISHDPKDDIFLACAKAAKADFLVSQDHDLLVLNHYEITRIVNTPTFLKRLREQTQG